MSDDRIKATYVDVSISNKSTNQSNIIKARAYKEINASTPINYDGNPPVIKWYSMFLQSQILPIIRSIHSQSSCLVLRSIL